MEPSESSPPSVQFPDRLQIVLAIQKAVLKGTWRDEIAEKMDALPTKDWPAEVWEVLDLGPAPGQGQGT